MPTVSAQYDIKSLIERYANIQVVGRPATVRGVLEYHSNCPFCGGTDRFITRPETGQYSCAIRSSGCGRTGDGIDFLREYCNMTHSEACELLGIEHNADFVPSSPSKSAQAGKEYPPPARWQESGLFLVERAQAALWSPIGKHILPYLHARGLGDEIIKKKRLGYVPLDKNGRFYEADLEQWGLDPATCSKDKVRVPDGILIPWFYGNELWRLALKRPGEKQSYGQVTGSGEGLFNVNAIQYECAAMIVEAEFCAMAVEQEAGDIVACVATGSTTRARLSRWVAELNLANHALQSFDEDESGDEGALYWMGALKEKSHRWSPWVAKDPNDILMKKFIEGRGPCTLREWVEAGLMTTQKVELDAPLARGDESVFERGIEPAPTISLLEQGIREFGGRVLTDEQAQRVSGEPIKPDFDCYYGCRDKKTKKTIWTWSSIDNECICMKCLSPSSWSVRNRQIPSVSPRPVWT